MGPALQVLGQVPTHPALCQSADRAVMRDRGNAPGPGLGASSFRLSRGDLFPLLLKTPQLTPRLGSEFRAVD